MSRKKSKIDLEWEQRILCSDEACIGTIGPDGKCRECGLPYEGQLPDHFDQSDESEAIPVPTTGDEPQTSHETPEAELSDSEDPVDDAKSDDEWDQRTLCSDESCIGVIGPDGRCKECGKSYEG